MPAMMGHFMMLPRPKKIWGGGQLKMKISWIPHEDSVWWGSFTGSAESQNMTWDYLLGKPLFFLNYLGTGGVVDVEFWFGYSTSETCPPMSDVGAWDFFDKMEWLGAVPPEDARDSRSYENINTGHRDWRKHVSTINSSAMWVCAGVKHPNGGQTEILMTGQVIRDSTP
jgi:hypothetical protein